MDTKLRAMACLYRTQGVIAIQGTFRKAFSPITFGNLGNPFLGTQIDPLLIAMFSPCCMQKQDGRMTIIVTVLGHIIFPTQTKELELSE